MKTYKQGRLNKRPNKNKFLFIFWICVFIYVGLLFLWINFNPKKEVLQDRNLTIKKEILHKNKKDVIQENNFSIKKAIEIPDLNLSKSSEISPSNNEQNFTYNIIKSNTKIEKIEQNLTIENKNIFKKENLPKLAIIIDDVAHPSQEKMINQVDLKLTPSVFPVSENYPKTANFAKKFDVYMIHLPLEALYYSKAEKNTILQNDDINKIRKILTKIRQDFPKAKFINNHTGSKFTSNFDSMKRLILVCDKLGFYFLDSKTIATTKVKDVMKSLNHKYVFRDVFLDNIGEKNEIRKELKKAVKIAKNRGFAIAIGHAKKLTLQTLSQSKDILKDVEVVYLKDIYEYYK